MIESKWVQGVSEKGVINFVEVFEDISLKFDKIDIWKHIYTAICLGLWEFI